MANRKYAHNVYSVQAKNRIQIELRDIIASVECNACLPAVPPSLPLLPYHSLSFAASNTHLKVVCGGVATTAASIELTLCVSNETY